MPSAFEIESNLVAAAIPPRRAWSRKGENGRVLVVGGSRIFHGAPTLAAMAAYRVGVDLVYVALPQQLASAVRAISPVFIVIPLPDLKLTRGSASRLLKWMPDIHSAVIGPGLGSQPMDGAILLCRELSPGGIKLVIDGDALRKDVASVIRGTPAVLTPHAGEFKRITGVDLPQDVEDRGSLVRKAAKELELVLLVKGHIDVISDGERVGYNRTGTPAMTVGGTGDILAGLVAGLMALGVPPFEAAASAAYVNGVAGERAASRLGLHLVPTDLLDEIPAVMKPFDRVVD